jgi:hypothetical protein
VYETHSKVTLENEDMIDSVITEMNNYATEKYMLTTVTSKQVKLCIIILLSFERGIDNLRPILASHMSSYAEQGVLVLILNHYMKVKSKN